MSEIMTLRTLICENIVTTYDINFEPQFLLAYNAGTGVWTAEVGRGSGLDTPFGRTYLAGQGTTPEDAYKDLLKLTATKVNNSGRHIYLH